MLLKVVLGLSVVHRHMKGEWSCVLVDNGPLSVMTTGDHWMLKWLVDNWATAQRVRVCTVYVSM